MRGLLARRFFSPGVASAKPASSGVSVVPTLWGLTELDEVHSRFPLQLPPRLALVTDLDNTLLGISPGQMQEEALDKFNRLWTTKYAPNNCVLVYATGRSLLRFEQVTEKHASLLKPDVLICKDGIDVFWFNQHLTELVADKKGIELRHDAELAKRLTASGRTPKKSTLSKLSAAVRHDFVASDSEWHSQIAEGWDQDFFEAVLREWTQHNSHSLAPLPRGANNAESFRVGVTVFSADEAMRCEQFFHRRVADFNAQRSADEPQIRFHSFHCADPTTGNWWACVNPVNAGKGLAVDFVRRRLHLDDGQRIIACGDSGNDISMLQLANFHAVVVSNCSAELRRHYEAHGQIKGDYIYMTEAEKTNAVIEGLEYFAEKIHPDFDWPIFP